MKFFTLIYILLLTLTQFVFSSDLETCAGGNEVDCKPPDQVEGDIDEHLNSLEQDDPILIEAIQNYYLDRPNKNFLPNIPQERLTANALAGQFGQANYVMKLYNFTKTEGFFFEAGAHDGVMISNTLLMETRFNWTGLLVEANPDSYSRLLGARRNVFSVGQCLSTKTRPEVVDFDAAGIFGGIMHEGMVKPGDNIPITMRKESVEYVKGVRKFIKMQCFPLYSLLLAVGNPTIDYLSLDIEGTELAVLESLPWDKVDIRVISLEICRQKLNDALKDRHEDNYPGIITLLESKGYKEVNSVAHTDEAISYEVIFAKSDLELNY